MKTFPQLVFGYHGCERAVAEKIVLGEDDLRPSLNRWDWLGTGAYFWEGAPDRAWDWARRHCKMPAVLGAIIDLGHCLNLFDTDDQRVLQTSYEALRSNVSDVKNGLYTHDLDCAVVNFACKFSEDMGDAYDTVRGAFPEGNPVFPDSKILTMTHVQICVRSPASVTAYFIPRV